MLGKRRKKKEDVVKRCFAIAIMTILLSSSVLWAQGESVLAPEIKKNSFGLGLGVPYGVLGANLDVNVAPNLNLSAGIGTTVLAGIGYSFGLKYFFMPIERTFRPRISAYYGVNTVVEYIGGGDNESYVGINLGIGTQWMWGKTKSNGLDLDIIYIATTGLDAEEMGIEEPSKVKLSIGYRHAF